MSKSDLIKKITKASKNPYIATLEESECFDSGDVTSTSVPALNIALSGEVDGGFGQGVVSIAGKSKHFKTLFALLMAKAYLEKYDDAIMVFFDSEFGSPKSYFTGILGEENAKRVLHVPVTTVEELRTEFMNQLDVVNRNDHVIYVVDSIGNLASIKETEDALSGKQTVDMTRAKMIKSLFRLITPALNLKNKTAIIVGHTYDSMELYSKQIMSGGTGAIYNSDTIFFIGKEQVKDGKELIGYRFIINIEKSRFVKEKMKIPVQVEYGTGLNEFSGMFDLAVKYGIIGNPTQGFYQYPANEDSPKRRRKDIENNTDTMREIVNSDEFKKKVKEEFKLFYEDNKDD